MIRKISALCLMVALFVVVGCASVQTAQKLNDQKLTLGADQSIGNVYANNWGLYFLWFPLITGDSDNVGSVAWLTDSVTTEDVTKIATKKAKDLGATKSVDLVTSGSSAGFLFNVKQSTASLNAIK